jgi:ketosteroid isomerase-like protein
MKTTAVVSLVLLTNLFCTTSQAAAPDLTKTELTKTDLTKPDAAKPDAIKPDPIKIVQAKFDAFNRHDVSVIESLFAQDATLQSPDYPHLVGNSKISLTYRQLFDAIPDAKDTVVLLDRALNRVYAQFVLTGHLKGAENKAVTIRILSVYTIENQRIVSDTTYYDRKM